MELYKLINGALVSAPENILIDGCWHTPATYEDLINEGFKPLKTAERPQIGWYERYVISYTENETEIIEVVAIAPIDNLKNSYISRLNSECDIAIVSGHVFVDSNGISHPVWLSMENQFNFSQVEVPCELKLGQEDWVDLTAPNDLIRFKKEIKQYITDCLQTCWQPKKAIKGMDDAQVYTYLKSL